MYHHVSHLFVFCLETALPTHHISYFTIEIIQQQGKKVCKTTANSLVSHIMGKQHLQ